MLQVAVTTATTTVRTIPANANHSPFFMPRVYHPDLIDQVRDGPRAARRGSSSLHFPRPQPPGPREVLRDEHAAVREVDHETVLGGVGIHPSIVLDRPSHDGQGGFALAVLAVLDVAARVDSEVHSWAASCSISMGRHPADLMPILFTDDPIRPGCDAGQGHPFRGAAHAY